MTDYRVYVIGLDGHFVKAVELDRANDSAAIETAEQFIDGHDLEVWQGDRFIVRLVPREK
jgi:hypothetical protein